MIFAVSIAEKKNQLDYAGSFTVCTEMGRRVDKGTVFISFNSQSAGKF